MQLKEISFEIIQRCPNNCVYCSSNSNCQSKNIISFDVFKRTIDDAVDLGLERVCISGGEPFLHPDIIKFIQYSKKQNLEVFVYTSGIVLNSLGWYDCLNKSILKELNEIGLDRLIYNVQSSDEILYNTIMGTNNCFGLMKTSIKNSVEVGLFSEIHFVPMKVNYKQVYSVLEMARELGVSKVSFLRLVIQGRALQNKGMVELSNEMNDELKTMLISLKEKYNDINIRVGVPLSDSSNYGCNASLGKLIIRYDGAVFPCEAFKYISAINKEKVVNPDNINVSSLKEIYHASEFLGILRAEIKEFKAQKLSCESCPAQWRLAKVLN
ncbi:MAG: radical SAM/SPASM domain-containing protein [Bacillota bacterium]